MKTVFAKKLNKVYEVNSDQEMEGYLARGFDIVDENGDMVEHSPFKTVSYSQFEALQEENTRLRALAGIEPEKGFLPPIILLPEDGTSTPITLEEMDVDQLKEYAQLTGVDIGNASSQVGILKKIKEAEAEADSPEEPKTLGASAVDVPKMGGGATVINASSEGTGDRNGTNASADSNN